jgi:hypothetical protein
MGLEKVAFEPNKPVDLALKWTDGKNMQGQFGPSVMFTTQDNRVMFLPSDVGDRVRALGLQPGEPVRICKSQGAGKKTEWQVQKLGEQPNGTFVIPKAGPALMGEREADPAVAGIHQSTAIASQPITRSDFLRHHARELVDAYADTVRYAETQHGVMIKPDDVRAIVLSVFIQMGRSGQGARV